jgi:hypothetical protein
MDDKDKMLQDMDATLKFLEIKRMYDNFDLEKIIQESKERVKHKTHGTKHIEDIKPTNK